MHVVATIAAYALAAMWFVSAISKLVDTRRWIASAAQLGVPRVVATAVPMVEIVLAALLAADLARRGAAWASVILLVAFSVLLGSLLIRGRRPPCACFGSLSTQPIGWSHLARNAAFIVVALAAALFR